MAFYLIGLGLNERGISLHGKKILKNCKEIYFENYTVDFPYAKKEIEKQLKIKLNPADRELVESNFFVEQAIKKDIALLVYGSPLSATTHISLINEMIRKKIKYKIIHSGSVIDAVAETGLQVYKFGKTTSLPKWQKNFEPKSFMDTIKENKSIRAHTLLLSDIGLEFEDAKKQIIESGFNKNEKIIVCSRLGVKSKIFYDLIDKISTVKIEKPFCFVIPGKMSDSEIESLGLIYR
jgi:diphthine synthase